MPPAHIALSGKSKAFRNSVLVADGKDSSVKIDSCMIAGSEKKKKATLARGLTL
jgi:hypothetical protein